MNTLVTRGFFPPSVTSSAVVSILAHVQAFLQELLGHTMHILIITATIKLPINILKLEKKNHVPYYVAEWDREENQIASI